MNKDVSVVIHTRNEEKKIEQCIKSGQFLTNKIIVVDMESEDRTKEMARDLGAKIYTFPKSDYVEPSRKFGIKKVQTPWIFILDADERITKKLAEEIKEILKQVQDDAGSTHYKIPRKNIFAGKKWFKFGGWWPDYQIRLIRKDAFIDWSKEIHSAPKVKGSCGYLENPLVHFFHGDFETMVNKTAIFESIEADLLSKAKKPVSTLTFFRKFLGELYRRLIKNLGFLDGILGIIESIYQAFSKTITYLFLYEKKLKSRSL